MKQPPEHPEIQKVRKTRFRWKDILAVLVLCGLIILTSTHQLHPFLGKAGLDRLNTTNATYLDRSLKKALGTFGVLSAVKVGLAVVEGTEFGVGFGVEVGDVVQSAYDYVDLAWRAVLTSAAILLGTRYLLDAADLLGPLFLILLWISILFRKFLVSFWPSATTTRRLFADITLLLLVLNLALHIVLPLSVAGGHYLSDRIIRQSTTEAEEGLTGLQSDLFPSGPQAGKSILDKLGQTKDRLAAIAGYLTEKTSNISILILRLIAGYLFDSLIFPLFLFIFLMWLTKTAAKYFFHLQNQTTFRNDLEQLFVRYYKRAHAPFQGERL